MSEIYPKIVNNAQLFSDKNHIESRYIKLLSFLDNFPTYFELFSETINHFSTNIQQNPPIVRGGSYSCNSCNSIGLFH